MGRLQGHTVRRADDEPGLDEDAVLGRIVASDDWRGVVEGLDGLPAADRDTLLLYAVGGFADAEIAAILDVPVGTVRSRISRARARLDLALDRTALRTAGLGRGPALQSSEPVPAAARSRISTTLRSSRVEVSPVLFAAGGDVAEEPAHDLAGPGLG